MIHHVFANRSNIGDWLSAIGIQQLLGAHVVTEHLCDEPFVPATIAALSQASSNDVVIFGGGGLFMDYFQPFWESVATRASHVPYCIWGAGYCELKREPSRPSVELMQGIAARAKLCVLRDELSRQVLAPVHLPHPVACPSLVAVEQTTEAGHAVLHVDNYSTAGADVYDAMEASGRAFATATSRPFRQTNNRVEAGNRAALAKTLGLYASSDVVLSSALHGCIIAVAMGRKVLAVSGDWKIEEFMNAAGLSEWVIGQDDVERIPQLLARLSDQPDRSEFVERAREENTVVASNVLATLHTLEKLT